MEDKKKLSKQKKSSPTENVRWHHSRWFWGVIILAMIAITIFSYYNASQNNFRSIVDLMVGIFWSAPLGIAVITLALTGVAPSSWPIILFIFRILFLLLSVFLLYKTFSKSKVKIAYPVLLIAIFIISTLFGILATSFV